MILSYCNDILGDGKRHRVKATVTTEHSASHYGQPVIVLEDGEALDFASWTLCQYQVVKSTKAERKQLARIFEQRGLTLLK
jgi:hypothetical protein